MGKGLMIIIMGSVITLMAINASFVRAVRSGTDTAVEYYEDIHARNLGNSMINFIISRIADDSNYRITNTSYKEFSDGTVYYRVVDTALVEGDTLVKIQTDINFQGYTKSIETFMARGGEPTGWVPPVVRGAWTANSTLNNTISDMYIDGRNYDLNLNIIPNTGVYGVSSSVDFVNMENAAIGGTYDGKDYAMTFPEDKNIIEKYDWDGKFPETPDEILGYPEGTLKALAKTGENGSQYLLNPDKKIQEDLTFPLSGVTYVEITDGTERELKMQGNGNGGILVVHGPNASSKLKGLKIEEDKDDDDDESLCSNDYNEGAELHDKTLVIKTTDGDDEITISDDGKKWKVVISYNGGAKTETSYFDEKKVKGLIIFTLDGDDVVNMIKFGKESTTFLGDGDDYFSSGNGNETIYGGDGADIIIAANANKIYPDDDGAIFCSGSASNSWFQGLIVTDYSFHHHLDILGAMVQLSGSLETDKNCNGNKDHWVKYSSQAIEDATGFAANQTGLVGNNTDTPFGTDGFGFGRRKAVLWYE